MTLVLQGFNDLFPSVRIHFIILRSRSCSQRQMCLHCCMYHLLETCKKILNFAHTVRRLIIR